MSPFQVTASLVLYLWSAVVLSESLEQVEQSAPLQLMTWNVWFDDVSGKQRYPEILDDLVKHSPELVFLQEITPSFLKVLRQHKAAQHYQILASKDAKRSYGQVFLSKRRLLFSREYALESKYGRDALFGLYELDSENALVLINVHLESGLLETAARAQQINAIQRELLPRFKREALKAYPGKTLDQVVWAGDFNLAYTEFPEGIAGFVDLAKHFGDNSPTYHIDNNQLAHYTASLFEDSARLDRILVSNASGLTAKAYQVRTASELARLSDHYSLVAEFE